MRGATYLILNELSGKYLSYTRCAKITTSVNGFGIAIDAIGGGRGTTQSQRDMGRKLRGLNLCFSDRKRLKSVPIVRNLPGRLLRLETGLRRGWDRAFLVTISGADAFTNQSSVATDNPEAGSSGAIFYGPGDDSTRLPADNDNGYVARFTDIDPGADGHDKGSVVGPR